MNNSAIKQLVTQQISRVWGEGRTDLVDELYADSIVDHMPIPGQAGGREALKQVVHTFRTAMPDLRMHLDGALACGSLGVDFWTLEGTHNGPLFGLAPTGKRVRFSGIDMVRVRDGRIAEMWHVEEMLHFFQQIGADHSAFGAPIAHEPAQSAAAAYDPGANAEAPEPSSLTAQEQRVLGIARTHIEELWAKGRRELAAELYHPDVVDHNPAPGQRPGIDGILDVLGWLREAVPDLRMAIKAYVVDGAYAADRWVMTGVHAGAPLMGVPAQGKRFEINGMDVIRVGEDGLISDVWHVEEFASLRAQIS